MGGGHTAGLKTDARKQNIRFDHAFHRRASLLGIALLERSGAKLKNRIAAEARDLECKAHTLHFHAVESARLAAGVRFVKSCKCIADTSSEEACRSLCNQPSIHQNQIGIAWQKRIISH